MSTIFKAFLWLHHYTYVSNDTILFIYIIKKNILMYLLSSETLGSQEFKINKFVQELVDLVEKLKMTIV